MVTGRCFVNLKWTSRHIVEEPYHITSSKVYIQRESQRHLDGVITRKSIAIHSTVYQCKNTELCWPPKLENNVALLVYISPTGGSYIVSHQTATTYKGWQ